MPPARSPSAASISLLSDWGRSPQAVSRVPGDRGPPDQKGRVGVHRPRLAGADGDVDEAHELRDAAAVGLVEPDLDADEPVGLGVPGTGELGFPDLVPPDLVVPDVAVGLQLVDELGGAVLGRVLGELRHVERREGGVLQQLGRVRLPRGRPEGTRQVDGEARGGEDDREGEDRHDEGLSARAEPLDVFRGHQNTSYRRSVR